MNLAKPQKLLNEIGLFIATLGGEDAVKEPRQVLEDASWTSKTYVHFLKPLLETLNWWNWHFRHWSSFHCNASFIPLHDRLYPLHTRLLVSTEEALAKKNFMLPVHCIIMPACCWIDMTPSFHPTTKEEKGFHPNTEEEKTVELFVLIQWTSERWSSSESPQNK